MTRDEWILSAAGRLVVDGIGEVKIDRIARKAGASRGSFYWHFANREALLDALVDHWLKVNHDSFARLVHENVGDPLTQLIRYYELWLDESQFDAALDTAMREWARVSATVGERIRAEDKFRMELLKGMFVQLGYDPLEAEIRSRVSYYHQVGYYALEVEEAMEERFRLMPTYFRVLSGMPLPQQASRLLTRPGAYRGAGRVAAAEETAASR